MSFDFQGWPVAQETRVAPHILVNGAGESRKLREAIGRPQQTAGPPTGGVMRDVVPATQQAAGALGNWLTEKALKSLLETFGDDLSRLGRRMEAVGSALDASAEAYRRNENANAALFRRADARW
jgi:hypothetical protein